MRITGILAVLAVLSQAGCSLLPDDRAMNYLTTDEQAETSTPAGQPLAIRDAYPIPELPAEPARPTQFEVPQPAPYLPEENADTVTSLAAYNAGALNPRMEKDGAGTQILRLDGNYAADWAAVTEALGRSDLKLTDLNRSTGTYYLEMETVISEEERSWWDKLWGKNKVEIQTYLLKMNRARNGVYLSLLTDADTLADEDLTINVLNEVKRQLDK